MTILGHQKKHMKLLIALLAIVSTSCATSQVNTPVMRTIEVTGQAEKFVDPDEIIFTITIEEYWKEEFEGKKYDEYRTKIEIGGIEESLIAELKGLNITMDQITLNQAGNYWRQRGKDFLINKTMDISLKDFAKANEIANTVKTRGVRNMNVSQMKHKNIGTFELEVKADAVRAAQKKAEILADVMGKKVKDVITIIELDQYANVRPQLKNMAYSRAAEMSDGAQSNLEYENFRKIKTEASVRVIFEIE